jgi:multisubunit Na+/H+ antiporter MnhB subunit
LDAVLLLTFVVGEDPYRGNGISRWDAYRSPGGALGPMLVASVGLLVVCAALGVYAAAADQRRTYRSALLVAGLACLFLVTPTIIGFSTN